MRRFRGVTWPWLALMVLSVWLHCWNLGERSFHHDESIHAKLSWDMAEGSSYRYDPTYHGPLLYGVVAATFAIVGDTDFTARLPIALAGIGLVVVAWFLRRPFGDRAAWWTGFLFTVSPSILFFGRFLRMDILELATASAAFAAFYAVIRGSERAWGWVGFWAGLAFATKENAYVTSAVTVAAAAMVALDRGPLRSLRYAWKWLFQRWTGVVLAAGIFVLVTIPLYTVGFSRPEDWFFPLRAITYWWNQHSIERVPGPWWFYLPRLLQYEFLILGAALAWVIRRWRKLKSIEVFLFTFGVGSVAIYIYLGEKVPWLLVHQIWAFVPLAGAQLARSFGPQGRWWSRGPIALLLAATLAASFSANFVLEEITPSRTVVESLHFVQTTPEFAATAIEAEQCADMGFSPPAVAVGQAVWPLNWYWRNLEVSWARPKVEDEPGIVFCDPEDQQEFLDILGPDWKAERLPLRSWWLMYAGEPTFADWMRYLLTRRPWSEIGSTEIVVLRRIAEVDVAEEVDRLYGEHHE